MAIDIQRVIACPSYGFLNMTDEAAIAAEWEATAKRTAELMVAREIYDEVHPELANDERLVSEAELVKHQFLEAARKRLDRSKKDLDSPAQKQ